ncbi:diguanylate cyclase [Roseofilum casamattae]|uniref:Diguanylate cyclase n=1 Tax=Roseofilum casamattae BLCC-M143 TaxID=3022442 RepID=A0ABT7C3J1_9CYAN|nr:diguanylate cyclase [Roseofilum casamattae]MDJ1185344.1 diguanylate cyclase [Roseofilum casamattae BLCC-M143]
MVDDTSGNRSLLARILVREGYAVKMAATGTEALRYFPSSSIDLVLLDVMMPDMDGYQVCQELKAIDSAVDIPVLFISAMDGTTDKAKGFEAGAADYISKPFEPVEVVLRIEHQLKLCRYQQKLEEQNAQLQLLLDTTEALSEAVDVDSAFQVILGKICQTIDWDFGEAWMPVEGGTHLCLSRGWYGRSAEFIAFREQSTALTFEFRQGLPGRVWATQEPEWIENVSGASEQLFLRMPHARNVGLKGALGVPICWEKEVLAVLVFLRQSHYVPQSRSLTLVQAVANQLAFLIQRKQAEFELRRANRELSRLAMLDGLTEVANRGHFDRIFREEWSKLARESEPLALILADVDHFKNYNDEYGHLAGDKCLRQIAEILSLSVRQSRDLVARYGGEEFVVLLPYTDRVGALQVAERIHQGVRDSQLPHAQSPVSSWVTLSLGVAYTIPCISQSPEGLIAIADTCLYQAKNQGRDRIILSQH